MPPAQPSLQPGTRPTELLAHERRVCRVFEARGQAGLGEALAKLDRITFAGRFRLESLYAAGGEGVVYHVTDLQAPGDRLVAKLPLVPFHRPVDLSSNFLRRRREQLREEARNLRSIDSRFLPRFRALEEIPNPLLDRARGGEFSVGEPVLIMEWMPGFDLDVWLARVHRSTAPKHLVRRNLDRVAVVLLKALVELEEKGFHYVDLRPGNLRMMGRPERRIRLLDAGSLVEHGDESGRFPHVPAYLPPEVFHKRRETGELPVPDAAIEAVMCGRTLYEVATGLSPEPGADVDRDRLADSHVSAPVAEVVESLAYGKFAHVGEALKYLERHAVKRVAIPMNAHKAMARPEVKAALGTEDAAAAPGTAPASRLPAEAFPSAAAPAAEIGDEDVTPDSVSVEETKPAASAAPAVDAPQDADSAPAGAPGPYPYPSHKPSSRWTPRQSQAPGRKSAAPPPKGTSRVSGFVDSAPPPPSAPTDASRSSSAANVGFGDAILPPSRPPRPLVVRVLERCVSTWKAIVRLVQGH